MNKVDIDVSSGGATLSGTHTINSLNKSIGIMLASYTRGINKQNKSSGSLFRSKTKAECVTCSKGITPSFYTSNGTTLVNINNPEKQYPRILFDYIHQNPVKANLVANPDEWEFSSAKDYSQNSVDSFVNKALARTFFDNEK